LENYVNKGGASTTSSEGKKGRSIYINANDLTGHKGLENTMDFIDSVEKGSFDYKASTLRKYGRIFSYDEIGKYSSKIKEICSIIKSGAEGIVLIYSQFLDGGLVPVALALEELGFTRFGDNAKSLFRVPPVEPVDVRTMKPRVSGSDFFPATYTMITGDPRISPNNDFEVKSITTEDNKEGHKIKVVLISNAGSEGLDFKFIRQVHILNPWYNMSRLEQIIGRAVRNFSHKDLPFEKRNVQIFLHGTLLEDDEEEAADLHVYRVAERKAVQIGKVSRVLKENAVDCIINSEQMNYSQENMEAMLKVPVQQILSNGLTIDDFKVGDAPYSATCDYMDTCEYTSGPKIDEVDVKEDTYTEGFIMMNTDKLLQKIRMLYREEFFYVKDNLFRRINTPKPYPVVQIYAALTQLIEDKNEFITDKYGRTGYLVNVGEYYLFQPSELTDETITIFDRSVPLDYKHDAIQMKLSKENFIVPTMKRRPVLKVSESQPGVLEPKMESRSSSKLIDTIRENYEMTIAIARKREPVTRGDENWYKHCGTAINKLVADLGVPLADALQLLVDHILDMLLFHEKVEVLEYIFNKDVIEENTFESRLKSCLEKKLIVTKRHTSIILYSGLQRKVMLFKKGQWVEAEPEDIAEVAEEMVKKMTIVKGNYNNFVGFVGYDTKNRYLVFKVKDTLARRNTGARCDEAQKAKRITMLNDIIGREMYTKENTKGMVQAEMCAIEELLMRYYQKIRKNDKIWFLDFETALLYQF